MKIKRDQIPVKQINKWINSDWINFKNLLKIHVGPYNQKPERAILQQLHHCLPKRMSKGNSVLPEINFGVRNNNAQRNSLLNRCSVISKFEG